VKSAPAGFECDHSLESSDDQLQVTLSGQLVYETLDSIELCWEAVRSQPRPSVVLDLSAVTFIASAALGSLLALRRWLTSRGCRLAIAAMSTEVRETLDVSGLKRLFIAADEPRESAA
jgi:anti-anti-sigma factor